MDIAEILKNVAATGMSKRYKVALNNDLEVIEKANIQGIRAVILFGSGARGELRGGSGLDITCNK